MEAGGWEEFKYKTLKIRLGIVCQATPGFRACACSKAIYVRKEWERVWAGVERRHCKLRVWPVSFLGAFSSGSQLRTRPSWTAKGFGCKAKASIGRRAPLAATRMCDERQGYTTLSPLAASHSFLSAFFSCWNIGRAGCTVLTRLTSVIRPRYTFYFGKRKLDRKGLVTDDPTGIFISPLTAHPSRHKANCGTTLGSLGR